MSQISFSDFEYTGKRKQPRRDRVLAEMVRLCPGACYLHSSLYACWLMYYMVCFPLLETHVAPELEVASL